jgi:hypothetical protein
MQKEEFRSLGIMADWDSDAGIYVTMGKLSKASYADGMLDRDFEIRQLRLFQKMLQEGGFSM